MGKVKGISIVDDGSEPLDGIQFLDSMGSNQLKKWLRQLAIVRYDSQCELSLVHFSTLINMIPYIDDAWTEVEGKPGVSGRLQQIWQIYDLAEQTYKEAGGRLPKGQRSIDLPSFMAAYEAGELWPGEDL